MATACKNTPLSLVDYPILLQDFTFVNILKYTDVLNKAHKCENNYNFVMTKGRELYSSRFVTDVKFAESEKKCLLCIFSSCDLMLATNSTKQSERGLCFC